MRAEFPLEISGLRRRQNYNFTLAHGSPLNRLGVGEFCKKRKPGEHSLFCSSSAVPLDSALCQHHNR